MSKRKKKDNKDDSKVIEATFEQLEGKTVNEKMDMVLEALLSVPTASKTKKVK